MSNKFEFVTSGSNTASTAIRTQGTLYSVTVQGDFDGGTGKLRKRASSTIGDDTLAGPFLSVGNDTLSDAGVLNIQVTKGAEIDFYLEGHSTGATTIYVHFEKIA